jgi:hypothetical protein
MRIQTALALAGCVLAAGTPAVAQTGSISGTVTEDGTGTPIIGALVELYDSAGTFVDSRFSSAGGSYSIGFLPTGAYKAAITFAPNHITELYDNLPCFPTCDVTAGTSIDVVDGMDTSGIDFALAPGASISGTVTEDGTAAVLQLISIEIYDSTFALVSSTLTAADGTYTQGGLPSGTYYAKTFSFGSHVDELYDDIPCNPCGIPSGDPIVLTAPNPVAGIDFALVPVGGVCSGSSDLDLTTTPPVTGNETFEACETITAGGTFGVESGGVATLRAGLEIALTDGFFVASSGTCTFELDPALVP